MKEWKKKKWNKNHKFFANHLIEAMRKKFKKDRIFGIGLILKEKYITVNDKIIQFLLSDVINIKLTLRENKYNKFEEFKIKNFIWEEINEDVRIHGLDDYYSIKFDDDMNTFRWIGKELI